MSEQSVENRPFLLEDARKALVIRGYVLTIETKLIGLLQSDEFDTAIKRVRNLLYELDALERQSAAQPCRCYEGYECCNGICEVWCS